MKMILRIPLFNVRRSKCWRGFRSICNVYSYFSGWFVNQRYYMLSYCFGDSFYLSAITVTTSSTKLMFSLKYENEMVVL